MLCGLSLLLLVGCAKDNIVAIDSVAVDDADDDISNTSFALTVQVVFSESDDATVTGVTDDFSVTVSGNDVTIVYSGDEYVMYELSGGTTDGFFKLYSSKKQGITLNSAFITNPNGAALNVQGPMATPNKGKRTFVIIEGQNGLADGASYTDTPSGEDEKAALFSEGQLIFSGDGSLAVTAQGRSGIVSDDYVLVKGGTLTVNVTGNAYYDSDDNEYKSTAGIKANDYVRMDGGTLTITNSGTGGKGIKCDGNGYFYGGSLRVTTTGSNYGSGGGGGFPGGGNSSSSSVSAKGIKCDGNLVFAGGNVVVSSTAHEGIEAKGTLTVTSGEVYSYSRADDAINSGGDFTVSGGYVCGYSAGNDGLDANGNFYIKGGVVYAIGTNSPEVAIDANTEGGYKLYLTGGTLIAFGGLESGSSLSQSCYSTSSWTTNTWYGLTVGSETYVFFSPSSTNSGALVVSGASTPTLKSGVTFTGGTACFANLFFENAEVSGGTTVSLSAYTGGNGGGGGGGNGPGGGGHGPF